MIQEWKKKHSAKRKHMHLENGDSSGYPNLNPIACPEKHRKSVPHWPAPGCQAYGTSCDIIWVEWNTPFPKTTHTPPPPKTNMSPMDYFFKGNPSSKPCGRFPVVVRQFSTVPCSALWNITKTGSFSPLKAPMLCHPPQANKAWFKDYQPPLPYIMVALGGYA